LNDTGTLTYTVTLDRAVRRYTISATGTFSILGDTGQNVGLGAMKTLGFTTDVSGSASYVSDTVAGSEYKPQFPLQGYLDFDDNRELIGASVNESASGVVEVISFGERRFMEFNLKYITDKEGCDDSIIRSNATGLQDARDFLEFITNKSNLEFMKDVENRGVFSIVLLESTPESKSGTTFKLKELLAERLIGYYETGKLKFRKIA